MNHYQISISFQAALSPYIKWRCKCKIREKLNEMTQHSGLVFLLSSRGVTSRHWSVYCGSNKYGRPSSSKASSTLWKSSKYSAMTLKIFQITLSYAFCTPTQQTLTGWYSRFHHGCVPLFHRCLLATRRLSRFQNETSPWAIILSRGRPIYRSAD